MRRVFGVGSGLRLVHACAHAAELKRRVIVNGELIRPVARSLGLCLHQCEGVVRIIRKHGLLSPERMALVVMKDPGLDDADIAEIFGRSLRWAQLVREQAECFLDEEPIDEDLEYIDAGLQKGDPTPEEILRMAKEIRESPNYRGSFVGQGAVPWSAPALEWNGYAFIQDGAA